MADDGSSAIAAWLSARGLERFAAIFEQHEIDVDDLPELTEEHLAELGLALGVRLKVLKAIRQSFADAQALPADLASRPARLAQTATAWSATQPTAHPPAATQPPAPASERRPVTVMFCDIVGSTRLASNHDPEDTQAWMLHFWRQVEQTAQRHRGHIAQHLGDGALIYFGYPSAHEDDAERAVLAGLALLQDMARQPVGPGGGLQVRIGIASGTVVLNEFRGQAGSTETLAIGHAVNLASRLQALASPDTIVVDDATKALLAGLFKLTLQCEEPVPGLDHAVTVFRVEGLQPVRSRFEARHHGVVHRFLGRSGELSLLLNRWQMAQLGHGQLVLITGEPGFGKSRLLSEAVALGVKAGHRLLQWQCSPHASSTPLHPVIEWLAQCAGSLDGEHRDGMASRLGAAFGGLAPDLDSLVDLLDQTSPAATSADPQALRLKTMSALVELVAALANAQPLWLVVEDLHWCDPTTLELLQRLLGRVQGLPLLLLATARPAFRHNFGSAVARTDLALPRLDRSHADALVRQVLGTERITPALLDLVAERADGVPLFVEELVRSLEESGAIVRSGEGASLNAATARATIPRSLDSILMARVDMLGPNKPLVQMAACIGRQFSLDLLAKVAGMAPELLRASMAEVIASELVVGVGAPPFGAYQFWHALVRDAAYQSLLISERQAIHRRVADLLSAEKAPAAPEVIAQHLSAAQMLLPAIEKWCEAGAAAKQRSADAEAIEHLSQALRHVAQLAPSPERNKRELGVLLALAAPLRSLKGFASAEVAQHTERAVSLADDMRDARSILPLLYNHWVYTFVTSHRRHSQALAQDILQRSDFDPSNLVRMTGLRAVAATQFTAGEFRQASRNFDDSVLLYGQAAQADLTHAVGLDGKVTALGYDSLARWCLGDAGTAHEHVREALTHAGKIQHISTTAFITYHQALLAGVLERDPDVLHANGRQLEAIGRAHRFEMWMICGKLLQSLGNCMQQPSAEHIDAAESLFIDFEGMGVVYRPLYGTLLAEACLRLGDRARAQSHVDSALALTEASGERWSEPEVCRMQALLATDARTAAQHFDKAAALASAQGARAWTERILASRQAGG